MTINRAVVFCKKCVISNQRPSSVPEFKHTRNRDGAHYIRFNSDGICDACLQAKEKEKINWKEREIELFKLCDKHRRNDGRYDVIVPGSGGKDSIFTSFILKEKYNMHPLTCTWAPGMYTDVGWKNYQSWINSGFNNYLLTPNKKVHRLLTKLAFKNLLHPFQPFALGQNSLSSRLAIEKKINLVVYGDGASEKAVGNNLKAKRNNSPQPGEEALPEIRVRRAAREEEPRRGL